MTNFNKFVLLHFADGCPRTGEYECASTHCIDKHLVCDGKIHCPDGSDESPLCAGNRFVSKSYSLFFVMLIHYKIYFDLFYSGKITHCKTSYARLQNN